MPWIVLLVSAALEAVWATALGHSRGLSEPAPTAVFAAALPLSMIGLGWSVRRIPVGTAYAVWTGLGAALTAGFAMLVGDETLSLLRVLFLALIVGAVAGLKLLPRPPADPPSRAG